MKEQKRPATDEGMKTDEGMNFVGQEKISRVALQKKQPCPTKKTALPYKKDKAIGWVEYNPRKNAKGEKIRYAVRRKWILVNDKWKKTSGTRIKSIPPMNEEDYAKAKTN